MSDDLISTQDAAEILGISKRAVIGLLNRGKIKGQLLSHQWIVSRQSVEEYKIEREKRLNKKSS